MTFLLAEALPSFMFKGDHGVTLDLVNDFGLYLGFYIRAHGDGTIVQEQDIQFQFIAGITFQAGNIQGLVFFHFILLTSNFYYSYHTLKIRTAKVGRNSVPPNENSCISGEFHRLRGVYNAG